MSSLDYSESSASERSRSPPSRPHRSSRSGLPPAPPKYFPDEDEIHSNDSEDSDFENDDPEDELRDFIDFDPKYNRRWTSRKSRSVSESEDPLRQFLFHEPARPRKWFKEFTQVAVGAKLTR